MYVDNRLIVLNSKDALQLNSTNLSNCVFNCQGLLTDQDDILRTYVSLINAQIPCSFYNIDATNNTINYIQSIQSLSFTIPIGNYSSSSLITILKTRFGVSVTSIVLDKATGKLIFTFNTNTILEITSTLAPIIGMTTNLNCFANVSATTNFPLNLLGIKRISIASDTLNISAYNSKGDGNILATIEVNQPPFNMLSYEQATDLNKHILHSKSIDLIDIQLYDENRNYINFNNTTWTMTLCLSIERNSEAYIRSSLGSFLKKQQLELETSTESKEEPQLTKNEQELKLLEG